MVLTKYGIGEWQTVQIGAIEDCAEMSYSISKGEERKISPNQWDGIEIRTQTKESCFLFF